METKAKRSDLANRQRVNFTLDNKVIEGLRRLSKETDVPMSKMVDKAILAMYGDKF